MPVSKKEHITKALESIGASWVRPEPYTGVYDLPDAKPTYHIHPDKDHEWQGTILKFRTLRGVQSYIQYCRKYNRLQKEMSQLVDSFWARMEEEGEI